MFCPSPTSNCRCHGSETYDYQLRSLDARQRGAHILVSQPSPDFANHELDARGVDPVQPASSRDADQRSGIPTSYDASKEWADKKVVLFAVPGAFTPGCSVRHLPGYIEKLDEIKGKAVDVVAVIAFNDAFVMSAWGKANGIKNDDILFLSDPESKFSKSIGWNLGERSARYAMIIDKGTVVYAEKEPARDVTVSRLARKASHGLINSRSRAQLRCLPSCRLVQQAERDVGRRQEVHLAADGAVWQLGFLPQ